MSPEHRARVSDVARLDRDPAADVLLAALTEPEAITPSDAEVLRSVLERPTRGEARADVALGALAAVLYSRPDVVPDTLLDPAVELLWRDGTSDCLWEVLATSPLAPRAWDLLRQTLLDPRLAPATRARLVPLVGAFVQWREDLVDLDAVLALAASPDLAPHRAALLDHGVERFVFATPDRFTPERLQCLAELFRDLPRYRYVLYALAGRPALPAASRATVTSLLEGRFAFHERAATLLVQRPIGLLVVLNVGMGQGDDLVRLVPLLQALLDANPALTVTLVTRRTYLYDNPRVTTVAIGDEAATQAALRKPYEGVLEFLQAEPAHFALRMELHTALEEMLAAHPPAFLVEGDMGRAGPTGSGRRSQFLHQRVTLDGTDIARLCQLDRLWFPSSYDPGLRLLAELGLPQRAGEERARTPSLLTGIRSADAERVWSELVPSGDGLVALVSPFGGSAPTKGLHGQEALLAAELEGLVFEGYRVVVLPQDSEWARPAAIDAALALLGPDVRARIRAAPDPGDADVVARLALVERPALSSADRVMRLFKYFTAYADLVVTVEGWLAHLAYLLGRPFRLFLAAGSYTADWLPHGRSPAQRLVPALSSRAFPAYLRTALLGPSDPPPLAHGPRNRLLEIALAGLGRAGAPEAAAPLRRALTSPASRVRAWAIAALAQVDPLAFKVDMLAALDDRSAWVVHEAASALLAGDVDCGHELGTGYRAILQAYVDGVRGNWDAVVRLGPAALPVLFRLAKNELHDVNWGARVTLREMLAPWVPAPPSSGAEDASPPARDTPGRNGTPALEGAPSL
jgi:hypothetical protein